MGVTIVTTELSGSDVPDGAWCPSEAPRGEVSSIAAAPTSESEVKTGDALGRSLSLLMLLPLPMLAQCFSKNFLKKRSNSSSRKPHIFC